jgi:hypothetical protein
MAKRKWDIFDEEAAREGSAKQRASLFRVVGPQGKRIQKIQKQTDRGTAIITNQVVKRIQKGNL